MTEYGEGDVIEKIECNGRGGTRVEPVFKYIRDHALPVDNMVYLTDMGIWDFPDNHPHYPVLWVSTDPMCDDAPFGRQHAYRWRRKPSPFSRSNNMQKEIREYKEYRDMVDALEQCAACTTSAA